MAASFPANVDIVYADDDQRMRRGLSDSIKQNAYHGVRDVGSLGDAATAITRNTPDIFLLDSFLESRAALQIIEKLRNLKLGRYPFMTVIACCDKPSGETLRNFVGAGIDYLVVKPIALVAQKRKPFEVSSEYIGPDRSAFTFLEDHQVGELIDVPNTVGMKLRGQEVTQDIIDALVATAMTEINAERLNQNSSDASSIINGMLERLLLTKEPSENLVSLLGSLAPALPICFGTTDVAEAATRQLLDLSKRVKLD
jgi:CheY-like chemotaxis protein